MSVSSQSFCTRSSRVAAWAVCSPASQRARENSSRSWFSHSDGVGSLEVWEFGSWFSPALQTRIERRHVAARQGFERGRFFQNFAAQLRRVLAQILQSLVGGRGQSFHPR